MFFSVFFLFWDEKSWKTLKINKKGWKGPKNVLTSFQERTATKRGSKYTTKSCQTLHKVCILKSTLKNKIFLFHFWVLKNEKFAFKVIWHSSEDVLFICVLAHVFSRRDREIAGETDIDRDIGKERLTDRQRERGW